VIDYFANWTGSQSCTSGVASLSPSGQVGSIECGGVPPAPWLVCGAVVALAALTLAVLLERRMQRGNLLASATRDRTATTSS
jgi:hypothetical protein